MKRLTKYVFGVTLLEVMLVLAIAAMIIVMSIRYYQSASSSQQANAFLAQLQAIVTAAEQMAQTTGSFATAINGSQINTSNLAPLLPDNAFVAPWGSSISIQNVTPSSFQVLLATIPTSVCPLVRARLDVNNRYSSSATAASALATCTTTNWGFYYIVNP